MEELVKEINFLDEGIEDLVDQWTLLRHECIKLTYSKEKVKLENHAEETVEKISTRDKKREKLLREIEKLTNKR